MIKHYKLIIFLAIFALLVCGCAEQGKEEGKVNVNRPASGQAQDEAAKEVSEESATYVIEDNIASEPDQQDAVEEAVIEPEAIEVVTEEDPEEVQTSSSGLNANKPSEPVRLIFIHHSTGENWLRDDYGNLGESLSNNNYFVSDTNYGWGPDGIGDRTDIINWDEWFTGNDRNTYMAAVFAEEEKHSEYTRTVSNPGGENEIVMFKSCFPNSNLEGHPDDEAKDQGDDMTVANAKFIYKDILRYFKTRPDKLFIIITAPPVQDSTYADNARGFNDWLVNDYLKGYDGNNVAVFDFYNILTGSDNHHRFADGQIQRSTAGRSNTLYYPSDDDHPSEAGSRKATEEFLPWLNVMVNCWKGDGECP